MKKIVAALILSLVFSEPAAAEGLDCFANFPQTQDMKCIDQVLETVRTLPPNIVANGTAGQQALVGSFAVIFNTYPEKRAHLLSAKETPLITAVYMEALYRAGLKEEARNYASTHGMAEAFQKFEHADPAPLQTVVPRDNPSDNDLLIGAYMASGDTKYIQKILDNFTGASDAMAGDAFRVGLVTSKFGETMTPPGRSSMAPALCEKYACKKDLHDFMRVMTLGTAFWATQSRARHDAPVKKTLVDFFEKNGRLNKLLASETNSFSNYILALAASGASKDPAKSDTELSDFEKFAPSKE